MEVILDTNNDFDFDKYFLKKFAAKAVAIEIWVSSRITEGASIDFVHDLILKKFRSCHAKYFEGFVLQIENDIQYVEEKYYSKVFLDFQVQSKLGYKKPIGKVVGKIEAIKKEAGKLGKIDFVDVRRLVNEYAYYCAYKYYCVTKIRNANKLINYNMLFQSLVQQKLFDETDESNFVDLFAGKNIKNKITWNKSLSMLRYFIEEAISKKHKYLEIPYDQLSSFIIKNFQSSGKVKNTKKTDYDAKSVSSAINCTIKNKEIINGIMESIKE